MYGSQRNGRKRLKLMTSKKKLALALLSIGAGLFILADYAGLFGLSEKSEFTLHEIKFRVADSKNNAPLVHTRAKCYQKTLSEACTQRFSGKVGIVSIMVPANKVSYRSLFFKQGEKLVLAKEPDLQVMLIHTDYMTQAVTVNLNEVIAEPGKTYHVSMQARGEQLEESSE